MTDELLVLVREVTGARGAERVERIQELWSGYGELVRVRLDGAERATVVVKWARPPAGGGESRISHARKCRSYDAETAFYRNLAPRCDDRCRVARLLGARTGAEQWILVLEDLDAAGFARRVRGPRGDDLSACLRWLATFHARFLGASPEDAGVWPVGTYWHLGTRQEELRVAARGDPTLTARAIELDRQLRSARFTTLLHGDAKPANFCFAAAGAAVAAVDFQYCGGGPGCVDVAYLLHGSPRDAVDRGLDAYFAHLRAALAGGGEGAALEREWRALFPVALADFDRFLLGWRR